MANVLTVVARIHPAPGREAEAEVHGSTAPTRPSSCTGRRPTWRPSRAEMKGLVDRPTEVELYRSLTD